MLNGDTPLWAYPYDIVEIACTKCDRCGRYRRAALMAIHGGHIGLPELRARLAADCSRMRESIGNDGCGVHYPALVKKTG